MLYCDKCKNCLAQRHVRGWSKTGKLGPFVIDLCARCYNEFRAVIANWLNNDTWAEADQCEHSNEAGMNWTK